MAQDKVRPPLQSAVPTTFAGSEVGALLVYDGSDWEGFPPSAQAGDILTSQGTGQPLLWQSAAGGGYLTTATLWSNDLGGMGSAPSVQRVRGVTPGSMGLTLLGDSTALAVQQDLSLEPGVDIIAVPGGSTSQDLLMYDGTVWNRFAKGANGTLLGYSAGLLTSQTPAGWGLATSADLASYQLLSQKGIANGYASLNVSVLVPTAQLGTGAASSNVWLSGASTWTAPTAAQVGAVASTTTWTLYRDTDFTGVAGASPWTVTDGVGSSTWTTGGATVSAASGLALAPGGSTTTFGGASITGAWVRSPITYLPTTYTDNWLCVAIKISHSVTPPGTAGQYMSPAIMLMTTTAASGARLAGCEFGGDGAALKVQARIYDSANIQGGSLAPVSPPTWVAIMLAPHGQSYRVGYGSPVGSPGTWTPASLTWSQPYYQVSINTLGPDLATIAVSAIRGGTAYTATIQEIAVFTGTGGV